MPPIVPMTFVSVMRAGDDAGEVAGLGLGEDQALVVRQQLGSVARAA